MQPLTQPPRPDGPGPQPRPGQRSHVQTAQTRRHDQARSHVHKLPGTPPRRGRRHDQAGCHQRGRRSRVARRLPSPPRPGPALRPGPAPRGRHRGRAPAPRPGPSGVSPQTKRRTRHAAATRRTRHPGGWRWHRHKRRRRPRPAAGLDEAPDAAGKRGEATFRQAPQASLIGRAGVAALPLLALVGSITRTGQQPTNLAFSMNTNWLFGGQYTSRSASGSSTTATSRRSRCRTPSPRCPGRTGTIPACSRYGSTGGTSTGRTCSTRTGRATGSSWTSTA